MAFDPTGEVINGFSVYRASIGGYVVRPEGGLGTHGFHPRPWKAVYVRANSPQDAVIRAKDRVFEGANHGPSNPIEAGDSVEGRQGSQGSDRGDADES